MTRKKRHSFLFADLNNDIINYQYEAKPGCESVVLAGSRVGRPLEEETDAYKRPCTPSNKAAINNIKLKTIYITYQLSITCGALQLAVQLVHLSVVDPQAASNCQTSQIVKHLKLSNISNCHTICGKTTRSRVRDSETQSFEKRHLQLTIPYQ